MPSLKAERLELKAVSDYARERKRASENSRAAALDIVKEVRLRGFEAVREYSLRFDKVETGRKSVDASQEQLLEAEASLSSGERDAMLEMKRRIARFASAQKAALKEIVQADAEGTTKLVFRPVRRVGIYVPAGRAPLFYSLFMAALPAIEAGVKEMVVCTPPQKDGKANSYVLAAANMCGVRKVLKIGGAQAIASMAFGLEGLLEPVDVICGPGNAYVNGAKMAVAGMGARIDVPAGPSEVLAVADCTADPKFVAADMLAQAEHGADSAAVCICIGKEMAEKVACELQAQLFALPKESPARESIARWGRIWVAKNKEEALEAANLMAVEHLEFFVSGAEKLAQRVCNAGAVFVRTAEAFCDYGMSGGNHILPTGASARSWSGLSVQTFGKWIYVDEISGEAQRQLAEKTALLARMEGLEAHARAAEARGKTR